MPKLRPNVCMLVFNREGLLFLGHRRGSDGIWQFPQGGKEEDLSSEENVLKELYEELGADKKHFEIVRQLEATHQYNFSKPKEYGGVLWDGQDQTFWAVRFLGKDSDIQLDRFDPEMSDFKWCTIDEVRRMADPKRLKGYEAPLGEAEDIVRELKRDRPISRGR